jgi:HK97 family phage major capsid protein/HK97 family phage prohead protease
MEDRQRPPRDNLVRAFKPGIEVRDEGVDGPVMAGHFAVFNEWTEIDSWFEGNFVERIAPGAFKKTFRENRDAMKVTFNHGMDPQLGDKVLGPIRTLEEDETGAAYEVPLLDAPYVRESVLPGLKAGLYGSSFRFRVIREEFDKKPKATEHNPTALPERTIKEAEVFEFGPVTYPAYQSATAGVRSLTDQFLLDRMVDDPERLKALIADHKRGLTLKDLEPEEVPEETEEAPGAKTPAEEPATVEESAPPEEGAEETHSAEGRREENATKGTAMDTIEEVISRQGEIKARQQEIYKEHGSDPTDEARTEFEALDDEYERNEKRIATDRQWRRSIERKAAEGSVEEPEKPRLSGNWDTQRDLPDDIHDITAYHRFASNAAEMRLKMRDGARRYAEKLVPPHPDAKTSEAREHLEKLLTTIGTGIDPDTGQSFAERVLHTSSPLYERAFGKAYTQSGVTSEEQRALSLTTTAGGYAVPITIDPTVIPVSNGVVNPVRSLARTATIPGNEWRGVTSTGMALAYSAEVVETTDGAPALVQPVLRVEKAQGFVPFDIEIQGDWASLSTEIAGLVADAKDQLEATKFVSGVGHTSSEPEGLNTGATAIVSTAGATILAVGDLYSLEEAVPPRFRPKAAILANKKQFNRIRALDTSGGSSLWVQLGDGMPRALLGYPNYEYSEMPSVITTGASAFIMGDFSKYLIVDKAGLNMELIPHVFGTVANYPTGQRGYYCWYRNSAKVLAWQAFRTLKVT